MHKFAAPPQNTLHENGWGICQPFLLFTLRHVRRSRTHHPQANVIGCNNIILCKLRCKRLQICTNFCKFSQVFATFLFNFIIAFIFSALVLLVWQQEGHSAGKKTEWCDAGMVICLGLGADLHIAQLMLQPLTISCSSKSRLVLPSSFYLSGGGLPAYQWVLPDKIQEGG